MSGELINCCHVSWVNIQLIALILHSINTGLGYVNLTRLFYEYQWNIECISEIQYISSLVGGSRRQHGTLIDFPIRFLATVIAKSNISMSEFGLNSSVTTSFSFMISSKLEVLSAMKA